MNELVIPVGLPGAGKSTFINENYKTYHILCLDDIRIAMGSAFNPDTEPFAKATFEIAGKAVMYRGMSNLVIDSTNVSKYITEKWIKMGKTYGYYTTIVIFDIPIEVCKSRQTKKVPNEKYEVFNNQMKDLRNSLETLGAINVIYINEKNFRISKPDPDIIELI